MQRRQMMAASTVLFASLGAVAQPNPSGRPIKWIVPCPAGGGTDTLARTLAEAMSATLGQTIVIENKPGAATNIGADAVAKSQPDGHTIMSADNAMMSFNEHLFRKLPYSPEKDFTYVGAIGRFPLVLAVHPDFPARDFKAFLAHVRANPGKVNYASVGNGSPHHLAMEMFKQRTKTDMAHVPYKGAAPATQDLMAGQVPVMFMTLVEGQPILQSNKARALAIGSNARSLLLPDARPAERPNGVRVRSRRRQSARSTRLRRHASSPSAPTTNRRAFAWLAALSSPQRGRCAMPAKPYGPARGKGASGPTPCSASEPPAAHVPPPVVDR
jgi:tripartite-type tricarboxylate transporter receptor subunit TctC